MPYIVTYKALEELHGLYPYWSPRYVEILYKLDKLDEIEKISIILECSPQKTSLQKLANIIDPGHNYKTNIRSWRAAMKYINEVVLGADGMYHYRVPTGRHSYEFIDGTPTEQETRLSILADLYRLFVAKHEYDPFIEQDWSEEWAYTLRNAKGIEEYMAKLKNK